MRVDSFAAMAAIRIFAATHDAESALNLIRVMRDEHTATLDEWRRQGGGEPAVAAAVERPRSAAVGAKAVSEEERAEDEALDFAFAAHLDEDDDDDAAAAAAALGDDAAADDESDDDDADAFGGLDELAETAAVRPSAVGPPKPKSPLTATVYTAAMGVCARGAKLGACERLLGMMRRDEVTPTDVTMATLVHACAQAGDWRRALDFLDEAERAGSDGGARRAAEAGADGGAPLAPAVAAAPSAVSLHAHGSALRACAKAGEHGLVLDLFERMKARGLTPNSYCYSQAILACEQAGSVRLARALLDEMPANGVPPNIFCFTAAVQVRARARVAASASGPSERKRGRDRETGRAGHAPHSARSNGGSSATQLRACRTVTVTVALIIARRARSGPPRLPPSRALRCARRAARSTPHSASSTACARTGPSRLWSRTTCSCAARSARASSRTPPRSSTRCPSSVRRAARRPPPPPAAARKAPPAAREHAGSSN